MGILDHDTLLLLMALLTPGAGLLAILAVIGIFAGETRRRY